MELEAGRVIIEEPNGIESLSGGTGSVRLVIYNLSVHPFDR